MNVLFTLGKVTDIRIGVIVCKYLIVDHYGRILVVVHDDIAAGIPNNPHPISTSNVIPTTWKRYQLSQLINKALSLDKPVPFDFLVRGEILRTSFGEWCVENVVGEVL
jgi:hypothetical protein